MRQPHHNHSLGSSGSEALRHARKRSFDRHVGLTVPILAIDRLEEKRAALSRRLHSQLPPRGSGCIRLPSDRKCPRSFGNWQNGLNLALLASNAMHARLHATSSMDCNSLMTFRLSDRLLPAADGLSRRTVELDAADICDWMSGTHNVLNADECLVLPLLEHGQDIPWCLKQRKAAAEAPTSSDEDIASLLALGPHAAYGAIFDAAFVLPNETLPTWRDDEVRISVHIRHFDGDSSGEESIDVFAAEIQKAAALAKHCAVLLASDRRLTLELMQSIVRRAGCRLLQSVRGAPVPGLWAEHGQDVGKVLLEDVYLLAHGHVLVGTWASTLTVAIQQAIAARSGSSNSLRLGLPPTVTYCDLWQRKCLNPLPLLTDDRNHWYVTVRHNGGMRISTSDEEMRHVIASKMGGTTPARSGRWMPFPKLVHRAWPASDEAVAALRRFEWPTQSPPTNAWLGTIISLNASGGRYQAVATAVAACGFEAHHVPAAMPDQYADLEEMMIELFGTHGPRKIMRMSAFELGLLISHKRALTAIARGRHTWGAIFEDDAILHPAVSPWQSGHLLQKAFLAAGTGSSTVIYLGACAPQCNADANRSEHAPVEALPLGLLHGGACRGYCTHAYAVSRKHAGAFFDDVFECNRGSAQCGAECRYRPCFMDWAFSRHFMRGHTAWLLGSGLSSPWRDDHRGLFIQNRSAAGGNNVSGTSLSRQYRWKLDTEQEVAARQRCSALIGGPFAYSNATRPLSRVFVTTRWTGRLGNLLFGAAGLMGITSRLRSIAPAEAFTVNPSSEVSVPARRLFERLPSLSQRVRLHESDRATTSSRLGKQHHVLFASTVEPNVLKQCRPCTYIFDEDRANAFERRKLRRMEEWVAAPPKGCVLGILELVGYFQSYKYFDHILDSVIRPALAAHDATLREANAILASARERAGPSALLVGVQVRLGDKTKGLYQHLYAQTDWNYYKRAMRHMATFLGSRGAASRRPLAFLVTAGGSMRNNSLDISAAYRHLSSATKDGSMSFSTAHDPYTDLAVLRGCDALVISSSSFGWWAAYLAKLPPGHVIAPRHVINPKLPPQHNLRRGFDGADYYPPGWLLLDNDGNGTAREDSFEEERRRHASQLARTGFRLEEFTQQGGSHKVANPWENSVINVAFAAARKARARAAATAKVRGTVRFPTNG